MKVSKYPLLSGYHRIRKHKLTRLGLIARGGCTFSNVVWINHSQ